MKAARNATNDDRVLQHARLSVAQENAVDALVTGKKDAEVAALVGVNRVTVTRWRLYHPGFIAALNERRQALWSANLDRLRSLVPLALDALADALTNTEHPDRLHAAFTLLKLLPPSVEPAVAPVEANEVVRLMVEERRCKARMSSSDWLDSQDKDLPPFESHVRQTWNDLAAKLETDAPSRAHRPV